MAIVYSPDGQPVQVFNSYIEDYLKKGYSTAEPNRPESLIASPLAALVELSGSIDINTASMKDLQSLPPIGVAIAKNIVANRPYKDLAELINKISEVSWMDLRSQITLSAITDKVEPEVTESPLSS